MKKFPILALRGTATMVLGQKVKAMVAGQPKYVEVKRRPSAGWNAG